MVHPVFMDWMAKIAEGTTVTFAMIPMVSVKYTYTIIPAMVMAWLLKYIDNGVDKITPAVTKKFLKTYANPINCCTNCYPVGRSYGSMGWYSDL
ncbi:hypothetical protein [Lactococcus fujiensis]|uniref:hypothetical protein n=1 Tax=Lactococcus fujiensis TaxID=610251 RepID=UPI0020923F41|nr:hypothetical protein [Lactococcus fujiensis]